MIRGERVGAPKELILLCLVSNRLSKQGDQLLSGLTRDFGVSSMVTEGLKQFKFDKQYPRVRVSGVRHPVVHTSQTLTDLSTFRS